MLLALSSASSTAWAERSGEVSPPVEAEQESLPTTAATTTTSGAAPAHLVRAQKPSRQYRSARDILLRGGTLRVTESIMDAFKQGAGASDGDGTHIKQAPTQHASTQHATHVTHAGKRLRLPLASRSTHTDAQASDSSSSRPLQWLVHVKGPITPALHDRLGALLEPHGCGVGSYVPHNTFQLSE